MTRKLTAALASLSELGFVRSPVGSMVRPGPLWDPAWGPMPTNPDLDLHVETLHRKQALLDRIREGALPSESDLGGAPTLMCWFPAIIGDSVVLFGAVTDHPRLGTSDLIHTSTVLAVDGGGRWARTMTRWYRLGEPAWIGREPT